MRAFLQPYSVLLFFPFSLSFSQLFLEENETIFCETLQKKLTDCSEQFAAFHQQITIFEEELKKADISEEIKETVAVCKLEIRALNNLQKEKKAMIETAIEQYKSTLKESRDDCAFEEQKYVTAKNSELSDLTHVRQYLLRALQASAIKCLSLWQRKFPPINEPAINALMRGYFSKIFGKIAKLESRLPFRKLFIKFIDRKNCNNYCKFQKDLLPCQSYY